ncbi:MAG: T9SS type A sorting domain-containing protein, partial [Fimbriimonadaceae bacterium]|nr:T9SS type A sorting domain-containing protein [Chitinophagales bacterium]
MKKILLLFLFFPCFVFSQSHNANWFFGDSVMLNFNDGVITPSKAPGYAYEASISYSDEDGNLLFYSDGSIIWNKDLEEMNNSPIEQRSYVEGSGSSMCQGSVVIPDPGNSSEYYIINHVGEGLKYSIIDMTLDEGLGDVEEVMKDIWIIEEYITEKLQAVKHANGRDWWVLFHKRIPSFGEDSTNTFYKLLITPEGISGPFEQNIGIKRNDFYLGQMVFSRDGSLLAYTEGNDLEIFNFHRCTGELSEYKNIISVNGPGYYPYGCAFSPNGSKIYISNGVSGNSKIFQYCLDCPDELSETKQLIYNCNIEDYGLGQMLLGPDDHIYFPIIYMTLPNSIFTEEYMNLCVINSPNTEGIACNLDTSTIWLGGQRSIAGLPNMLNYNLGALAGSDCDTLEVAINNTINKSIITIYPNPTKGYLFFKGNFSSNQLYNIIITDAQGKKVFIKKDISLTQKLNISNLP